MCAGVHFPLYVILYNHLEVIDSPLHDPLFIYIMVYLGSFHKQWWIFLISFSSKLVDLCLSLIEFTFSFLCLNPLLKRYYGKGYHSWICPLKFRYSSRLAPISMVVISVIVGRGARKVGIVVLLWSQDMCATFYSMYGLNE